MALTNMFNGDELYGHMSDEMHRFYEGVLKERREHNRRGHMPAQAATVYTPQMEKPFSISEPTEAPAREPATDIPPANDRATSPTHRLERIIALEEMAERSTPTRRRKPSPAQTTALVRPNKRRYARDK